MTVSVEDIVQGTEEWYKARLGKVTGSKIADVLMKPDKAGYRNYLTQLVLERLTGEVEETYESYDMTRGKELEPIARSLYEFEHDCEVVEVGFIDHPYIENFGCSPDGLVGDRGMIEIKCPKAAQHKDLLFGGEIDSKYVKQMQEQMACADRDWVDYCSYHPGFPEPARLFTRRVWRDQEFIGKMETAVVMFLNQVALEVAELEALCNG